MARPLFDSEYIFGIHEPGGENEMIAAGKPGWIVFTEGIGSEPDDRSGRDYTRYSNQGLGIIARLNNGYHPAGTIPYSRRYEDFAQRCANFVAASRGCKIWIIGNEMNYHIERPQDGAFVAAASAPLPAADGADEPVDGPDDVAIFVPAGDADAREPAGALSRWWNRFLGWVSGGMGEAELGHPVPPASAPSVAPPPEIASAAVADPENHDPRRRSDPSRFDALHGQSADGPGLPGDGAAYDETDDDETDDEVSVPAFDVERDEMPVAAAAATVEQVITPELYARCYRLCRDAIHAVPGHEDDQVLIGAVAPWNVNTTYPGNPSGDWVQYMSDILLQLGPDGCDGITIHTYTHQADPNLIRSDAKMNPPFENRHFEFRTYQDFMQGIPANMRHLPVYITETDQDVAWLNQNIGWVQQAYGEINWWNQQPGNQQIRALILYRWPRIDKWYIEGKQGVIQDFRQSLAFDYKWRVSIPPPATFAEDDVLKTLDIVNLRATPGYANQPADDVLLMIPQGGLVTVLSSTFQPADGLTWWLVSYIAAGEETHGWLAQTSPAGLPLLVKVDEGEPPVEPPDSDAIAVGSRVRTLDIVRMRTTPGYQNKPADDVVADVPLGTEGAVLAGPQSVDGLTWWQVSTIDGGQNTQVGWMAEVTPDGIKLLEKIGELVPPSQGGNGTFARGDEVVTLDVVRLRKTPGYQNKPADDVVADLPVNTWGTVTAGPRHADDLTWWQLDTVNADGNPVAGWAAEVAPNGIELLDHAGKAPPIQGTFERGDSVQTLDIVRMRRSPGYVGKTGDDVVTDVPAGAVGAVVDGPRDVDGLTWWLVHVPVLNLTGWMAETSPNGLRLLGPAESGGSAGGSVGGRFSVGELVQAATDVRVRRSPGYRNKPEDDVLGAFAPATTLNIVGGPREQDGLTWWHVGGISLVDGELVGWVADQAPNGTVLMQRVPKLAGTNIPDRETGSYLGAPFRGRMGISQLWGERPEVYKEFTYDGVPLKGHNGIDFLTVTGTDLLAVDDGLVEETVYNDPSGFGNYVKVRHQWGESIYAHMLDIAVQPGQSVRRGRLLGRSDNTGFSGGPHLHFSIRIDPYQRTDGWGGFSDPLPYLDPAVYQLPAYVLPEISAAFLPAAAPAQAAPQGPGMAPDQPGVTRP